MFYKTICTDWFYLQNNIFNILGIKMAFYKSSVSRVYAHLSTEDDVSVVEMSSCICIANNKAFGGKIFSYYFDGRFINYV